jgi:glutathione synthase/RimK-type ligase-like ATP-grasp enzyme
MKFAVHDSPGSFSKRWIEYLEVNLVPYKLVNCYSSDIISQLEDCDVLMWHFHHSEPEDFLFAKQLLYSVEASGKKVFPDFHTMWHFDDKVGQKYLLEALGAPLVNSYVFYSKKEALKWAAVVDFPKVFKLRGGAGSVNVKLVRSKETAINLINKAFGRGFRHDSEYSPADIWNKFRNHRASLLQFIKAVVHRIIPTEFARIHGREKGYIYFQDFIPGNKSDTRVIVIGDKAFAIKREVRENDFRASGSGKIIYDHNQIDLRCIKTAFNINAKLNAQCLAYDFVFNGNEPQIVEISFGFAVKAYDPCPGYWDTELKWNEFTFNPQNWMIELLLNKI